ncbi:MAG: iron-sulfur cluster assembly accessory protein [Gammaproteobacteria bacterium]|nr:iron-sulfur cluster assembly accessory protein [Gammaproteobacteria bacterium]
MAITLTDSAARHVKALMADVADARGLRLGLSRSGCSGFAYQMDIATAVASDDHIFTSNGVDVIVDAASLAMLDGTELDYVREGLNELFKFKNPNVKNECGCGESVGF